MVLLSKIIVHLFTEQKNVTIYLIYFPRASWSIVEKMKKTKGYEPPDIHFLQKDFESCVLSGDIECQYIAGTDVEDYPGTVGQGPLNLWTEHSNCQIPDLKTLIALLLIPNIFLIFL